MIYILLEIIKKKSKATRKELIEEIDKKFSTIFYDFKDQSSINWNFYLLFVIKRMIIIICYNFIKDGVLEISFMIGISALVSFIQIIFYIGYIKCFKLRMINSLHFFNETIITIAYILIFVSCINKNFKNSDSINNILVSLITLTWISNLGIGVYQLFYKLYMRLKSIRTVRREILPENITSKDINNDTVQAFKFYSRQ